MKSLKLVFLIWLFCQMLICESTAQQVLFAQAGYNIYSGTQSYQTIPIRLGYGRLFNSGFSIEPTITYEKSLNKDIHSQLAFGIGARYYFNRKI